MIDHLISYNELTPDSEVRSAKQNGTDCRDKLKHEFLAHADT